MNILSGDDGGKIRGGEFEVIGVEAQPVRLGFSRAHPDVWVRRVLDAAGAGELLVLGGEEVVHFVTADERRGAEWDVEFIARAVVVAEGLTASLWDRDGEEGGHLGRVEEGAVKRGVNVPAVEARVGEVILFGDGVLVEFPMVRVYEGEV